MNRSIVTTRYARALALAVENNDALVKIQQDLRDLRAMVGESHELRDTLSNPAIRSDRRSAVAEGVLNAMQADPIAISFVKTLIARGRISQLAAVLESFDEEVDRRLDRVTAQVISARPLSDEQREHIVQAASRMANRSVDCVTKTDPSILGGAVIRLGGYRIDGSLRARLNRLKAALLAEEN